MGTPIPSPKRGRSPQIFCPCLLRQIGWVDQDDTWRGGRPQPRGLCVRWGPSPLPKKGAESLPNFRPMSIAAKRLHGSRCLGPDDIVLDGDPAPPSPKGDRAPSSIFCPCLLWPNCWMDQGGTWHGGGPWSRPHCARWGHSSPPQKRDRAPNFWPMSIGLRRHLVTWYGSRPRPRPLCIRLVPSYRRKRHSSPPPLFGPYLLWPRSPISATAELLFSLCISVHVDQ